MPEIDPTRRERYRQQLEEERRLRAYRIEDLDRNIKWRQDEIHRGAGSAPLLEWEQQQLRDLLQEQERTKTELDMILRAELQETTQRLAELEAMILKPPRPPRPTKGNPATLAPWFEYYHALDAGGFKYTLGNLAADTGYYPGYIKQLHAQWKRSNQI